MRYGLSLPNFAEPRPWVLARQVTTVDHLSAGRAVLGVGLGVPPDAEYGAFGGPRPRRPARRGAGVTWLIERPAPGEEWLDDAAAIAAAGPRRS